MMSLMVLLEDLADRAGADGAAAFTNREAGALLERDRHVQLRRDRGVVPRHHHLHALRQLQRAGDVGRADVELRTVAVEERRVTAAFLLREDVDLALELRVRLDRAGLREDLAALDVRLFHAAEQHADVVAGDSLVQQLAEHLDAGDDLLLGRLEPDDLDFLADLDLAALDAAGHDGAAAGDREHVFDRHQERLVNLALRHRDVGVERVHQLEDGVDPLLLAVEGLEGRHADDRDVVAGEAVRRQQLTHLELDEIHQFGIVDRVDLVQGDDQVRHVDLTREQHVLAGLRHRTVDRGHDENAAVHLRCAGDHVLDVVGVTRAVHVRVVTVRGRILDVAGRDRQDLRLVASALRLGRLRDLVIGNELRPALVGRHLRERRRQRRLAVVDVTDGAHVDVRFGSIEFLFCHCRCTVSSFARSTFALRASLDNLRPSLLAWLANRSSRQRATVGADDQDRTGALVLTKDVLYQLSYIGLRATLFALALRPTGRPQTVVQPPNSFAAHGLIREGWSGRRGSNPRPTAWKAVTLPLSYSRKSVRSSQFAVHSSQFTVRSPILVARSS